MPTVPTDWRYSTVSTASAGMLVTFHRGFVMSDDFETIIGLNEQEIELLGNLIVAHMINQERVNPSKAGDRIRPESVFMERLLRLRTEQIVAARAGGKFVKE